MKTFAIMRRPCMMEDEGRHTFIKTTSTKAAAQKWIDSQVDSNGADSDGHVAVVGRESCLAAGA